MSMTNPPVFLEIVPDYKPSDPPPRFTDVMGWWAWSEVQDKAGIKQTQCRKCKLWFYPAEKHDSTSCHRNRAFKP